MHFKKDVLKWEKISRKVKPNDEQGRFTYKMSVSKGKIGLDLVTKWKGWLLLLVLRKKK